MACPQWPPGWRAEWSLLSILLRSKVSVVTFPRPRQASLVLFYCSVDLSRAGLWCWSLRFQLLTENRLLGKGIWQQLWESHGWINVWYLLLICTAEEQGRRHLKSSIEVGLLWKQRCGGTTGPSWTVEKNLNTNDSSFIVQFWNVLLKSQQSTNIFQWATTHIISSMTCINVYSNR